MSDKYKIKTLEEFLNVALQEDVDPKDLMKDFEGWFYMCFGVQKMDKSLKSVTVSKNDTFTWINDGKHDAHVSLNINIGEQNKCK